jgi:hypothetical protein
LREAIDPKKSCGIHPIPYLDRRRAVPVDGKQSLHSTGLEVVSGKLTRFIVADN